MKHNTFVHKLKTRGTTSSISSSLSFLTTLPLPLLHQNLLFPHNQSINRTHPRARVANFLLCSLTLYLFLCFFFCVQDITSERKQKKRNQHVLKIQYSLPSLHNQNDQQEPIQKNRLTKKTNSKRTNTMQHRGIKRIQYC